MTPTRTLLAAALLAAGSAQAQSNLGELLDLGASKLGAAEVRALGDTRVLRQGADSDAYLTLRADGTVVGMVHNKQGAGSSEAVGRWQVDANGQRCSDVELPAFGMRWQQCGYVYRVGRDIWFAPSDSDRGAALTRDAGVAFLKY
jgi:hypothetical protein